MSDEWTFHGHHIKFTPDNRLLIDGDDYSHEFHGEIYSRDKIRQYIIKEIDEISEVDVPISEYQ